MMYCTVHLHMCNFFLRPRFHCLPVMSFSFSFLILKKLITNYTIEENRVIQSLWMNSL